MKKSILLSILLFTCSQGFCQEFPFAALLRLKSQADSSYIASEDPAMQALASKHGVSFSQQCPDTGIPEQFMYYSITGTDKPENFIKGKFTRTLK